MKTIGKAFATATLLLCPLMQTASAQRTSYDVGSRERLAGIQTFAFKDRAPAADAENATTYDSPLIDERVKASVSSQLQGRGLKLDNENPDVFVVTHRTYRTEIVYYPSYVFPTPGLYGWGAGYGAYSAAWGGWGPVYQEERIMGRLTVDVHDAKTGALLWRGVGEKHVHEKEKPSRRDERVNDVVSEIFEHFPGTR